MYITRIVGYRVVIIFNFINLKFKNIYDSILWIYEITELTKTYPF